MRRTLAPVVALVLGSGMLTGCWSALDPDEMEDPPRADVPSPVTTPGPGDPQPLVPDLEVLTRQQVDRDRLPESAEEIASRLGVGRWVTRSLEGPLDGASPFYTGRTDTGEVCLIVVMEGSEPVGRCAGVEELHAHGIGLLVERDGVTEPVHLIPDAVSYWGNIIMDVDDGYPLTEQLDQAAVAETGFELGPALPSEG